MCFDSRTSVRQADKNAERNSSSEQALIKLHKLSERHQFTSRVEFQARRKASELIRFNE